MYAPSQSQKIKSKKYILTCIYVPILATTSLTFLVTRAKCRAEAPSDLSRHSSP
jgi:hypothetical protein